MKKLPLKFGSFFLLIVLVFSQASYAQYGDAQNDKLEFVAYVIIILIISIIIFLICREILCWYFKINERIALLREIRDALRMLAQKNNDFESPELSEHYTSPSSPTSPPSVAHIGGKNSLQNEPDATNQLKESFANPEKEAALGDKVIHNHEVYKVVFDGDILPEKKISEVQENFKRLYNDKYNIAKVQELFFSGKYVAIKTNLNYQEALTVKERLASRTGGLFIVKPM